MKFGVEIPGIVDEAFSLDEKNDNTLWQDYIKKEMNKSCLPFKPLERYGKPPVGYTEITCYLVFDLMPYMTRKYQYMEGGHLMDVTTHITYSSVMSRYNVCAGFHMDAMNGLEILAG